MISRLIYFNLNINKSVAEAGKMQYVIFRTHT